MIEDKQSFTYFTYCSKNNTDERQENNDDNASYRDAVSIDSIRLVKQIEKIDPI